MRRAARRPAARARARRPRWFPRRPIGRARSAEHRPGVERLDDAHDGDACFALAGDDGAMNGRGAPIARQERRVHVDHAESRRRRAPRRAGSSRTPRRRRCRRRRPASAATKRRSFSVVGLQHRQASRERPRLDGRVDGLLAAAARPIGLGDDARRPDGATSSSASSVGTAKAGVPKNTTRRDAPLTICPRASASGSS